MTFLEGFAQGFGDERKRRLDKEDEDRKWKREQDAQSALFDKTTIRDKNMLQYQIELTGIEYDRKTRLERAKKDQEIADQAKNLAGTFGAPDAADQISSMLRGGQTAEGLTKLYTEGKLQVNKDWKGPETTIKVPEAVSGSTYKDPYVVTPNSGKTSGTPPVPQTRPGSTLTNGATPNSPATSSVAPKDGPLKLVSNEIGKVPPLADSLANLQAAKDKGDTEGIQKWTRFANAKRAEMAANQPPTKNLISMFIPPKIPGMPYSIVTAESHPDPDTGESKYYDTATNQPVSTPGAKVATHEQVKEYLNLSEKYKDKIDPVVAKQTALVNTMGVAVNLNEILTRNPQALSFASEVASWVKSATKEADAFSKIVLENDFSTDAGKAELEKAQSDPSYAAEKVKEVDGVIKSINSIGKNGILSEQAKDSVLAKAYKSMLIYNLAAAYGQKGNSVGVADIKLVESMIGGNDPQTVREALGNAVRVINNDIDGNRAALKTMVSSDSNIRSGYVPSDGFSIPRTEDIINAMEIPNGRKAAMSQLLSESLAAQQGVPEAVAKEIDAQRTTTDIVTDVNGNQFNKDGYTKALERAKQDPEFRKVFIKRFGEKALGGN